VHPIERLRYVARSGGADQASLVHETAGSLGALGLDPAEAVTACRRVVQRHPYAGALWTLCNRILTAVEPRAATLAYLDEIDDDPTASLLEDALPDDATVLVVGWPEIVLPGVVRRGDVRVLAVDVDGEAASLVRRLERLDLEAEEVPASGVGAAAAAVDVVVLEACAAGPQAVLAGSGSRAAAAVARQAGRPVWLCVGAGRALAPSVYDAAEARLGVDGPLFEAEIESVPVDLCERVLGPTGWAGPEVLSSRADAPVAPELLKTLPW
jgi:hypothetical protein